MDDVLAELVRNIVNERQAKGKEFVDCRVMEGRPTLWVTVPAARKRKGSPLPENDIVWPMVRTGLSGPGKRLITMCPRVMTGPQTPDSMPESGERPISWVTPCPRVVSRPQTPDSLPELERAEETESDDDTESVSDSEWRDRLANNMEFRACAEPQVASCSMRNDLGGGKGYQLVPVCAGLCQSVPVWEQGSTCSWTGLAPGWSDLGGLRMRRSRWGWVQWHCHDEVESSITFPHPSR